METDYQGVNFVTNNINHSAIVPFDFNDQPVRVVTIDGEPWFVLGDIARVLDISDVQRLNSRLDDDVRQTHPIVDTLGRTQQTTIVNESGMYEVVLRSDKPDAKKFRRWITGTVLPTIRKTGSYQTPRHELTGEQLRADIAAGQMNVLALAKGIVDDAYLEVQGRFVIAQALGKEPELNHDTLPLDVESYLRDQGLSTAARKKHRAQFGKRLKAAYVAQYGVEPLKVPRTVNGTIQNVNGHTRQHLNLFDMVRDAMGIQGSLAIA